MTLQQSIATFYVVVMAIFSIGFLINWYRNRTVMVAYKRIGFWAGVMFVVFELVTLAISGGGSASFNNMCVLIALLGWDILRVWGFVNTGIFFSNQLNIRSFPLIAPRLGLPAPLESPAVVADVVPSLGGAAAFENTAVVIGTALPSPLAPEAAPLASTGPEPIAPSSIAPSPIPWPRYWLNIGVMAAAAVAYSAVLFLVAQPRIGLALRDQVSSDVQALTPVTLIIILEFAFAEELLFRLGIQNYLGAKLINTRYGYAIAILLTSALWTLAHVGTLDPDWVKLAQIFPLGLALGWLYRKQGIESTLLVHGLFNVLGALVLPPLYLR